MGLAADRDDSAIGLRVLHLDPMEHAFAVGNQVVVAVLAEWK
jgi:hypothetical protein